MKDLVAVGVADAGHEALVLQEVLELAGMPADPLAPDVQGQRWDRRRQGRVRSRTARVPCGRARRATGRPCPSASGRGTEPPRSRRRPASRRRAWSRRPVASATSGAAPNDSTTAVFVGSFSSGRASWNRPVSIGLTTTRSRSRSTIRNLPRRRMSVTRWPTSASSSAGVPRTARGPGAATAAIGRPTRAAWNASATTVRSGNSGTAGRL